MIDLKEVAVALDAFPHWDENMRAEVFHAIDVAPEESLLPGGLMLHYTNSPADKAWGRIQTYDLDKSRNSTLGEASGYESAPTKGEILKALHRGARMIR